MHHGQTGSFASSGFKMLVIRCNKLGSSTFLNSNSLFLLYPKLLVSPSRNSVYPGYVHILFQVRFRLRRLRTSKDDLGGQYEARGPVQKPSSFSHRAHSVISSARSRASVVSHNQVAPQRITPVERDEDEEDRSGDSNNSVSAAGGNSRPKSRRFLLSFDERVYFSGSSYTVDAG